MVVDVADVGYRLWMVVFPVCVVLCSRVRKLITVVRIVLLVMFRTCIVSSFVPWVPLIVIAVIGMLVGTRMTESRELTLLRHPRGIGMLTIGSGASVVSTLGRRVVFLVLVTIIPSLWARVV